MQQVMNLRIDTGRSSVYYPSLKPIIIQTSVNLSVELSIDPNTQDTIISITEFGGIDPVTIPTVTLPNISSESFFVLDNGVMSQVAGNVMRARLYTAGKNVSINAATGVIDALVPTATLLGGTNNNYLPISLGNNLSITNQILSAVPNNLFDVATAKKLSHPFNLSLRGDVTGNAAIDGSADVALTVGLINSGVTPGTFNGLTVNSKGIITAAIGIDYVTTDVLNSQASNSLPIADNATAAIGTSLKYARADHIHPTDLSRAPVNSPNFTGIITIPRGIINNTTIGITTPAAGAFTTFSASGASSLTDVTITNSLIISHNITIGGTLSVTGIATLIAGGTSTTPAIDNNSNSIATTAYYIRQASSSLPITAGTANIGNSLRFARADHIHPIDVTRAPINNPTFTGTVTIPGGVINATAIGTITPSTGVFITLIVNGITTLTGGGSSLTPAVDNNSTAIATTAYYNNQASSSLPLINGNVSIGISHRFSRADHIHPIDISRAALISPVFTGNPTAPTPIASNNSQSLATTAYVKAQNYIIGNQLINITGDVTGAGTTNINLTLHSIGIAGSYTKITTDIKGRVISGTNITIADVITALGYTPININLMGTNNGLATLDSTGKLITSQLPDSVIGATVYEGVWNAATNTPALANNVGVKGNYYKVSVAGNININGNSQWNVGDLIIFNGNTWDKIDGLASEVTSVFGRIGAVVLLNADIITALGYTPINKAGDSFTGSVTFNAAGNSLIVTNNALINGALTIIGTTNLSGGGNSLTPLIDNNSTAIATTAYYIRQAAAINPLMSGIAAIGISTRFARADHIHPSDTSRASVNSPVFSGNPTAPTPLITDNSQSLATTAYVKSQGYATAATSPIISVFGRTGVVVLLQTDVISALNYTPINKAGDTFTGNIIFSALGTFNATGTGLIVTNNATIGGALTVGGVTILTGGGNSLTPLIDNNSNLIATTAYYNNQASSSLPLIDGTAAIGISRRFSRADHIHPSDISRAPIDSPTFIGIVTIPSGIINHTTIGLTTPAAGKFTTLTVNGVSNLINIVNETIAVSNNASIGGELTVIGDTFLLGGATSVTPIEDDNGINIATTAYVIGQAANTLPLMDSNATIGDLLKWARADHIHPIDISRAPIDSPTFIGLPAAPTPNLGDFSTSLATTEFVKSLGYVTATTAPVTSVMYAKGDILLPQLMAGGVAPIDSPHFTGIPRVPTASPGNNSLQIANTAYVQNMIVGAVGGLNFKGMWNASTNTPLLTSGVGNRNDLWIVSVSGIVSLDGISTWSIGDEVLFNGATWQRIPNTSTVNSVFGRTGIITLLGSDVTTALTYIPANRAGDTFSGLVTFNSTINANAAVTINAIGTGLTVEHNTLINGTLNVAGFTTLSGGSSSTPAVDNNSSSIATTAYVIGQASILLPTMNGIATIGNSFKFSRADHIHPIDSSRAPLNSPTFAGAVNLPSWTTATRPVTSRPGTIGFSMDYGAVEIFTGTAWVTSYAVTGDIITDGGSF